MTTFRFVGDIHAEWYRYLEVWLEYSSPDANAGPDFYDAEPNSGIWTGTSAECP